ncbi:MAG: non-heme iron oxygenase ferredoxin subunit [Patescibacteria group bacterium]
MSTPTILCRLDDISDGGAKRVVFDGQSFAVFRHGEEVYAISDRCSHQGGSLSNGFLDGNVVECPWHGAMFDIRTGEALSLPAVRGVSSLPVRVVGGNVIVDVS